MSHPIRTCLWFDTQALDAAQLYTSLLPDGAIEQVSHYTEANQYGPEGTVLQVEFRLGTQLFTALNGGPHFTLTPAASIQVYVPDQVELDRVWDGLLADGGAPSQCGWLVDRFGLSWQIIPALLGELMSGDPAAAERTMAALLRMGKLDIAALQRAHGGSHA